MKTVCIDIDGTICSYIKWRGSDVFGQILPEASDVIHKLHEEGWFIIIFSTRSDRHSIAAFLNANSIYYDAINENPHQPENAIGGKPIADVYLDDRAITFKGSWEDAYTEIVTFVPWEKKGKIDA